MLQKFLKRLAVAVVTSHVAVILGLQYYKQKKTNHTVLKTEEDVLSSWMTPVEGIPLVKDIATTTRALQQRLEVRDTDVYVVSYPKSGTTWLSEIVYNILTDLNFNKSKNKPIDERVPYMEWLYPGVDKLNQLSEPRIIKSHLPSSLLPKKIKDSKCKVIYIMRNPRDVCVSYYYFTKMIQPIDYQGSFHGFFKFFVSGKAAYGDWWSHAEGYWGFRKSNFLFITYEELSREPVSTIVKVAKFLGRPLTVEKAEVLSHHCSFGEMSSNSSTDYHWLDDYQFKTKATPFYRKGKVGDWVNYFSADMIEELYTKQVQKITEPQVLSRIQFTLAENSSSADHVTISGHKLEN